VLHGRQRGQARRDSRVYTRCDGVSTGTRAAKVSAARRLAESAAALRAVFRNRELRRLELAWAGSTMAQWLSMVALGVYAFDDGGATVVGGLAVVRYLLGTLAAAPLALLADRLPKVWVMVGSDVTRACALAGMAANSALGGPAWAVYGLACLMTVASTSFRPAHAAALPAVARTPEELTAANVTAGTLSTLTGLFGAALGGVLFAATSAPAVFAATAVCCSGFPGRVGSLPTPMEGNRRSRHQGSSANHWPA
jgi:hypothetical protein